MPSRRRLVWSKAPFIWILVGSYDNKLHCVDSTDGKAVWTFETGNYINGSPAVSDQKTVFGGCDAMIHVVSLINGSKVTEIDSGSYIAASAAFADPEVYVGNYDNIFLRADIDTGKVVWKYTQSDAPFFSSPAVGENVVVFGGRDQRVHCVNRSDGTPVWTFQTRGEVDSSPVICGDKVVVGSEDGRLYMIRLSDGGAVWSYETGQPITSSPAVARGMVVVGCDDGYVYAFGIER
jgi:outer membrane protein assembly factor BamB